MNLPLVSVAINNYNYARFLSEAIESALSQSYSRCEVIVVDDGSADNSREVIEGYGNKINAIYKPNGGQASALNAGFAASHGEIVIFLDADDLLSPEAAEALVRTWQPGIVRVQYPLEVIDADGAPEGTLTGGSVVPHATLGPFGGDSPTSGNAFSRTVLEKIMPIPEADWRICADAYLTATSSLLGRVVSLDRPLARYRVHGESNLARSSVTIADLRRALSGDFNLHSSLLRLAPGRIGSCEEWLGAYPQHWVGRIASLRESPSDHPWNDTLPELTRKAVSAAWRQPYWNYRRKLIYSLWVVAYAISPKRMARGLKQLEASRGGGLAARVLGRRDLSRETALLTDQKG